MTFHRTVALALSILSGAALAQSYPSKVVRLVVPYPPGGSAEAQARIVAQALSDDWKQPVIIENKPGAGTTVGAAYVAKAAPDGYTLYLSGTSHSISVTLYKDLGYDAVKSFTPISLVAVSPLILTVHTGVKADSVREFIALAKAKPNALSYASSGSGASPHLSAEMFASAAGFTAVHVPFKGTGPATAALLGAQVDYSFADVAVIPNLRAGKLKALAVTTARRSSMLPDVPTIAEAAILPGYETTNWSALLAPPGLPRPLLMQINTALRNAIKLPEVRDRFAAQGFETLGSSPEELEAHLASEVRKYAKAIADSGAKVD
jgi:tripartite-type tricarboxylate transporter receptor subunit TctC